MTMDKKFFDRADRFVALANDLADSMMPEEAGDAMLYGTSRYMAFLITRATAGGQGSRKVLVDAILDSMERALRHHLAQMPLPATEPAPKAAPLGAPSTSDPNDPDEAAVAEAYDRIGRAFGMLDIVLAAYLRGAGEHEAADVVTIPALSEPAGAKPYLQGIYRLWQAQLLPEPLAAFVINHLCTMHLLQESATGYVTDPVLDSAAKDTFVQLFSGYGLHHFATVLRKDPKAFATLCSEGMATLLGDSAVQMEIATANLRERASR